MADEQIRLDVLVDAQAAIKQIKQIADNSETGSEAVKRLSSFLLRMSKETKVPLEQLRKTLMGINNELARKSGAGLFGGFDFGKFGGADAGLFKAEKAYTATAQAAGRFQTTQDGVVTSINRSNKAFDEADRSARGYGRGIDFVRTAMGTLAAVAIFQFLNAISAAFTQLLHNIRETELAIYNLINAERRLSEQGIEVTPEGLQETIEAVRELVPVLSQIQAEELVSRIATNVAPALKLTNEEIRKMAEATALLYIRNKALGKSFDEVEAQLTNAFLTGKVSQGINNLGVKLSDQIVKDEALRLGLVKTEEQFNSLTGEMEAQIKASAMLSVVYKNATQDIETLDEYMQTSDAQISRSQTAWSDLLTVIGSAFGPAIAQGMEMFAHSLELIIALIEKATPTLQFFVANIVALLKTSKDGGLLQYLGGDKSFFEEFANNQKQVLESFKELGEAVDTPTAAIEDLGEAIDELDMDGLSEKIEDIIEDTENAREDLAESLTRKLEDLDEEYHRKALDAEQDYRRKVEDINRDAERDIANLRERHREEDLRDEERYQLQLWELRMRFLMDLEDALHARDARQVIRLQKQYNIDKEALGRKHDLDERTREEDQRNELEDIERRRQERIEDAKLEYAQKLADQRVAKQRELEDLNVWYAREQADLELAQQRKLETLLKGWVDEQKITESNAAQVYGILAKYFGPGGMTDALYQYMMNSLLQASAAAGQLVNRGGFAAPILTPGLDNVEGDSGTSGGDKGGGQKPRLAPTRSSALGGFGSGLTPSLSPIRQGGAVSRASSGGGINGNIVVALDLSPDLEARVVENSMNGVAEVVMRVNNSK